MIMNNLKKAMPRTWNYGNIQKPVRLIPQKGYDGVSITPEHEQKRVLNKIEDDDIIVITPIHEEPKGTITRAFGDLLTEEVV